MQESRKAESREGLPDGIKEGPGVYFLEVGNRAGGAGVGGVPPYEG